MRNEKQNTKGNEMNAGQFEINRLGELETRLYEFGYEDDPKETQIWIDKNGDWKEIEGEESPEDDSWQDGYLKFFTTTLASMILVDDVSAIVQRVIKYYE